MHLCKRKRSIVQSKGEKTQVQRSAGSSLCCAVLVSSVQCLLSRQARGTPSVPPSPASTSLFALPVTGKRSRSLICLTRQLLRPLSCTLLCGFVTLSGQSIRISCMIPTVPQMHAPSHPPKHQDRKQTTKARLIYKSIIRLNSFSGKPRMQMNPVKFEMNLLHLL